MSFGTVRTAIGALVAASIAASISWPASALADVPIDLVQFQFAGETEARDWVGHSGRDGLPAFPGSTPADASDDDPPDVTQAGAHPTLNLSVHFCDPIYSLFMEGLQPAVNCFSNPISSPTLHEQLKDLLIRTPPGLLGNPRALPYCKFEDYRNDDCPLNTRVGVSRPRANITITLHRTPVTDIYNVEPLGSELARFGAVARPGGEGSHAVSEAKVFQDSLFTLRANGDFSLDGLSPNFTRAHAIGGQVIPFKLDWIEITLFGYTNDDPINGKPFLTNPTSCAPAQVTADVNSYQSPLVHDSITLPYTVTGCENVPFTPTVDVERETDQAGAPSGYTFGIEFPNSEDDPIHQAHLKGSVVTLPEGVALAAPAAHELEGCTEQQFGQGDSTPVQCPAASKIGDVSVETPVLDADTSDPQLSPLKGRVFFAQPTPADPWRIFMAIEDAGMVIKLIGDVEVDEATGQVTTTFEDNPPTPFTRFELKLRGGPNAVLQNPVECGTHTVEAEFAGWAQPDDPVTDTFDLETTGCTTPRPFGPTAQGFTDPKDAGAYTDSTLIVDRPDGHQLLKKMDISLPPGLVGSLNAAPLCEVADATAGTCGDESKIGSVKADVGAGPAPIRVGGEIFLAKPLVPGDAAGLSIVVPAKTGPIDLGDVVTTARVKLRQSDGGIDVSTGDLPPIFAGVHLPVRGIEVLVDREGFFQNPTSCDPRTLNIGFTSHGDATAAGAITDSATNCQNLDFAPQLELTVSGETGKNQHPALRAVVTQDPGQSGISRAEVLLPQVLRPDVPVLNRPGKLCRPDQIALNACPAPSNIGTAKVHTPLLPEPLSGPVYIVQDPSGTNPLPRLVVQLRGMVAIDLGAQNLIRGIRTMNIFENVPDVPQSRFELSIVGGNEGILKNFVDLCEDPDTADATFFGHSGAIYKQRPRLKVAGCKGGVRFGSRSVRATKKGIVPLNLTCSPHGSDCKGVLSLATGSGSNARKARAVGRKRFTISAGDARTVRVKLSRRARQSLRRKQRLRLQAIARLDGVTAAQAANATISVRGPKRR